MKTKILLIIALTFAVSSICFAQSKAKTSITPDVVVKNLYAAQKADKSPFFQTKNRAIIDEYFGKDFADMIWKDSVDAKGEVGAIDFDPLYNAQDTDIKNFVIGKPREDGSSDRSIVSVTFTNFGKAEKVVYELAKESGKWKITGISYSNGDDLVSYLRYSQDKEFKAEYDSNPFMGDYLVGKVNCLFTPTMDGFSIRIQCDNEESFKLYEFDGDESENRLIYLDEKGIQKGKFVFKNGETNGKFFDAKGKESTVTKVKTEAKVCGLNLEITEKNANGLPVQNVTATAINDDTKETFKATLFEAMPVFNDLSEGKYQIIVMKKGYKNVSKTITLDCSNVEEDDPSVTENIFLQKETVKQSSNQTQPDTKINASTIRSIDFLNFTYQSTVCSEDLSISKTIKVKNGKFKAGDNYYNIIENKVIYGDINGDGMEDAVIQIICGSSAGSLKNFEIHAFTFQNGKTALLAQLDGKSVETDYKKTYAKGFVVALADDDVKIEKGGLIVQVLSDGSNAGPKNIATFDYKLSGAKFTLNGKPQRKPI